MVISSVILDHHHWSIIAAVNGHKCSHHRLDILTRFLTLCQSLIKSRFLGSQALITNCTCDGTRWDGIEFTGWHGQCTCFCGMDSALAFVAWTWHLLRWRGHCTATCCGGVGPLRGKHLPRSYGSASMQLEMANTKFVE